MIKKATFGDRMQIAKIWQESFGDTEEYINDFLDRGIAVTLVYREQTEVVGIVSILDVCVGDKKGGYIYALATRSDRRGKGVAGKLLEYADRLLTANGYSFSLVVPEPYARLEEFYKKRGFTGELPLFVTRFDRTVQNEKAVVECASTDEYFEYRKSQAGVVCHTRGFFDYVCDDLNSSKAELIEVKIKNRRIFCVCYNRDGYVIIKETLPAEELEAAARAVMDRFDAEYAVCVLPDKGEKKPYALIKHYENGFSDKLYANLLLDSFESDF